MSRALLAGLLLAGAAEAAAPERGDLLYRSTLLRAAPGRQLELIAAIRAQPAGSRPRLVLRHAQGDHWDVMVLAVQEGYGPFVAQRPGPLAPEELLAWQEDTFVRGPDVQALAGFKDAGLFHVEMFVALAGRRAELVREREMENEYQRALGRPTAAVFVRELGGAWDAFTVAAFRTWKHYAERDDVPPARSAEAARSAGFEGDDRIGPYLRSLIHSHHDTLATPVR
jgi:hypothetical protein